MSKKVIFLADSISTQTAGIHFFGKQLIETIIQQFPDYQFTSIATARIEIEDLEQIIIPVKPYIPAHLRLRQLRSIPRLVRQLKPDIVVELAHFGPFALPATIKRITVIHDLSAITHPQYHSFASHIVQKMSLPGIIKKANSIITNSYFTKTEIIRLYKTPESKIQVLYPKQKSHAAYLSDKTNIATPQWSKYFLCVGTIEPRKNYITIVKAFEKIHAVFPEYRLVIAGKPGWKNDMFYKSVNTSSAQSKIELTGYVNDKELEKLYRGAFTFISASHFEGFGMPILEAAEYGLPLIIAHNTAQYEIAQDAALLFDSLNVNELEKQMRSVIIDEKLSIDLKNRSSLMAATMANKQQTQLSKLLLE